MSILTVEGEEDLTCNMKMEQGVLEEAELENGDKATELADTISRAGKE